MHWPSAPPCVPHAAAAAGASPALRSRPQRPLRQPLPSAPALLCSLQQTGWRGACACTQRRAAGRVCGRYRSAAGCGCAPGTGPGSSSGCGPLCRRSGRASAAGRPGCGLLGRNRCCRPTAGAASPAAQEGGCKRTDQSSYFLARFWTAAHELQCRPGSRGLNPPAAARGGTAQCPALACLVAPQLLPCLRRWGWVCRTRPARTALSRWSSTKARARTRRLGSFQSTEPPRGLSLVFLQLEGCN